MRPPPNLEPPRHQSGDGRRRYRGGSESGIVVEETDASLTLQATEERVVIAKEDIDERETPAISMMPDGQFDTLSNLEICDLIAYLASKSQVPLPPEPKAEPGP